MFRLRLTSAIFVLLTLAGCPRQAPGQSPLTLSDAISRARSQTPEAQALDAAASEAATKVAQARSGYFPRVDVIESVQRGDQPVFAFSSLLSQRRLAEANLAIDTLNHPEPITNVRTGIAVEQTVFDGGHTWLAVRGARIGRDLAASVRASGGQDLALAAAAAFVRVLQLEAETRASAAAVDAAESDVQRARARRDAGVVTDADVLTADVHAAAMRERRITATADLAVARIELNNAIGSPSSDAAVLVRPPSPSAAPAAAEILVADALGSRHERRAADLRMDLATNAIRTARAAFLPRVALQGSWEANGPRLDDQRSSWLVGAQVQLNLFRGFGDAARATEARHAHARAAAERAIIERRIEVEVRAAGARLEGARGRERAGQAALAQARESQRILRDRYEAGLATITDVLRAAEAVLDAEARATAAEMDVILAGVMLDRATGGL